MEKKIFENEAYIVEGKTDYLYYVTKSSSREQRKKFNIGDIYINGVVCMGCKDYIRSKNKHDFVTCSCGNVSVDGGSHYARRIAKNQNYIDVIEYFNDINAENNTINVNKKFETN